MEVKKKYYQDSLEHLAFSEKNSAHRKSILAVVVSVLVLEKKTHLSFRDISEGEKAFIHFMLQASSQKLQILLDCHGRFKSPISSSSKI